MSENKDLRAQWEQDPHARLAVQTSLVNRFGRLLMSAGAGAYRTKASMARVAAAVGIERQHTEISMTDIMMTSYANGTFRTTMAEQRGVGVNVDRLERLNAMVSGLKPDTLAEDLDAKLDAIEKRKTLYNAGVNALASGVACAGFSFLNGGGIVECFAVFVGAFFGQLLRRTVLHRHMNHFGAWMLCALVAASIYVGLVALLWSMGFVAYSHQSGYIASILFLVPGFPMVTAMLDLVRGDYLAGISRATYVMAVMAAAGVSVWVVSYVFAWPVAVDYEVSLPWWAMLLGRIVASFIASFGFAMLFNTPLWICALSGLLAAVANPARLVMSDAGMSRPLAVGIAALFVGLVVAGLTYLIKCSRVSLSVPAVVIMIPGVPLYRSITTLNQDAASEASGLVSAITPLLQVGFTILAIGIGLALARMLTDRNWAFESLGHKTPDLYNSGERAVR